MIDEFSGKSVRADDVLRAVLPTSPQTEKYEHCYVTMIGARLSRLVQFAPALMQKSIRYFASEMARKMRTSETKIAMKIDVKRRDLETQLCREFKAKISPVFSEIFPRYPE